MPLMYGGLLATGLLVAHDYAPDRVVDRVLHDFVPHLHYNVPAAGLFIVLSLRAGRYRGALLSAGFISMLFPDAITIMWYTGMVIAGFVHPLWRSRVLEPFLLGAFPCGLISYLSAFTLSGAAALLAARGALAAVAACKAFLRSRCSLVILPLMHKRLFFSFTVLLSLLAHAADLSPQPWPRHVIDASSRGADGVRRMDVNGDGLLDLVTGWEEGGTVRVCLHPGQARVREPWPGVTVGQAGDVEDAVFADLDGDGAVDVISASEGETRSLWVHWAAPDGEYMDAAAWQTEPIPASAGTRWMFSLPVDIDGRNGIDFVSGGKQSELGWWESPADARDLAAWRWHPWRTCGWLMSLVPYDMDSDGDEDIVFSDRRESLRGCYWFENPGRGPAAAEAPWAYHPIGGTDHEVMFLAVTPDPDGTRPAVLAATRTNALVMIRQDADGIWSERVIPLPETTGTAKSVAFGDIDSDGALDAAVTCENARDKLGVFWLEDVFARRDGPPPLHDISGVTGTKYDLAVLDDLDGDGDLDLMTCEEAENLGVIWYENPAQR